MAKLAVICAFGAAYYLILGIIFQIKAKKCFTESWNFSPGKLGESMETLPSLWRKCLKSEAQSIA